MATILHIDASVRESRSLSRALGRRFITEWKKRRPSSTVIHRDLGLRPLPGISEQWIAAAFTPKAERTPEQHEILAVSDMLIDEIARADVIAIATPMYNYGMPSALKAWVDQVVRVNETFTFDLSRGDTPLEPVMTGKIMVLLTSAGEFGFEPGGVREHMNHLVPHLRTVSKYLGVVEDHHIGVEYQEFGDDRHARSIDAANASVPRLIECLTNTLSAKPGLAAGVGPSTTTVLDMITRGHQ